MAENHAIEWAKIAVIPLVVALGGYFITSWQKDRDNADNNNRLYTQLVSQREQSDTTLRTEMFKAVIEKFLSGSKTGDPRDMVLKLELLAYNFHESLDLGPLFKEVLRILDQPGSLSQEQRKGLRKRLDAAAANIIVQQVAALRLKGQGWSGNNSFEDVQKSSGDSYLIDGQVPDHSERGKGMRVRLQVLAMDVKRHEIKVRLLVQSQADSRTFVDRHFHVSLYDFPMLDSTRLPNGQRCSVVLTDFYVEDSGSEEAKRLNSFANIELVVFPATSGSLKERIEYDELLRSMLRSKDLYSEASAR
jgi:hypothetical protein